MLLTGGRSLYTRNSSSGAHKGYPKSYFNRECAVRRKRRQVQTGTDRNAAAVRLVRAKPSGAMMHLTKSDAFEKVKPTKFVFLLTDVLWSMGRWWKVPAKAYSKCPLCSLLHSAVPGGGPGRTHLPMLCALAGKREVVDLHTTLPLSGTCQTPKRMGK